MKALMPFLGSKFGVCTTLMRDSPGPSLWGAASEVLYLPRCNTLCERAINTVEPLVTILTTSLRSSAHINAIRAFRTSHKYQWKIWKLPK